MEKSSIQKNLIGKLAIVRATVSGVHAGRVKDVNFKDHSIVLEESYRLWRVYTRDDTGSISDIAAHGLKKPLSQHSIGAKIGTVVIYNPDGLEIAIIDEGVMRSIADASLEMNPGDDK